MEAQTMERAKRDRIEVLYESDGYLVVNKPYDMYINSDDPEQKNTLICLIAHYDSHRKTSTRQLHFAHRLDYATSGAICLAKHKTAAARAGRCFEARSARKYYVAVVRGRMEFERADVKYNVGIDSSITDGSNRMRALRGAPDVAPCVGSRAAHTRMLCIERGQYEGDTASVVILKPYTGRRHQLRVHCSAVSHTILGDFTYSDRGDCRPHRMFLHALRLVIPLQNEPLDIETEEPFFTDSLFASLWKTSDVLHNFKSAEERKTIYDMIDSDEFCNVNYKCFNTF